MLCIIYIYRHEIRVFIFYMKKTLHAQCVSYPHPASVFSSSPSNNRPCLACCQRCGLCLYGCLRGISEGYISAKGDVWLGCCHFQGATFVLMPEGGISQRNCFSCFAFCWQSLGRCLNYLMDIGRPLQTLQNSNYMRWPAENPPFSGYLAVSGDLADKLISSTWCREDATTRWRGLIESVMGRIFYVDVFLCDIKVEFPLKSIECCCFKVLGSCSGKRGPWRHGVRLEAPVWSEMCQSAYSNRLKRRALNTFAIVD